MLKCYTYCSIKDSPCIRLYPYLASLPPITCLNSNATSIVIFLLFDFLFSYPLPPFLALTLSGLLRPCDWQLPIKNINLVHTAYIIGLNVTYLVWTTFRSNDLLSRSNDLLYWSNDLLSCSNDLLFRSNDLVSRSNDLVSRSNDLVSRSNDLNIYFTLQCGSNALPYITIPGANKNTLIFSSEPTITKAHWTMEKGHVASVRYNRDQWSRPSRLLMNTTCKHLRMVR